jgi:hypothetical protein
MTIEKLTYEEQCQLSRRSVVYSPPVDVCEKALRIIETLTTLTAEWQATAEGYRVELGVARDRVEKVGRDACQRISHLESELSLSESECAALRYTVAEKEQLELRIRAECAALRAEVERLDAANTAAEQSIQHLLNDAAAAESRLAATTELLGKIKAEIQTCETEIAARDWEDRVHIQADGYRHICAFLAAHGRVSDQPAAPAYGSSPVGGANLRPEHRPTVAELIAAVCLPKEVPKCYAHDVQRDPGIGPRPACICAQPAAPLPPHERSDAERAALFSCLEKFSNSLCQTQGHILRALEQSGLSVVLSAKPAAPGDDEPLPWVTEAEARIERMRAEEGPPAAPARTELDDQDVFPGMPPAGWVP